MTYLACAAAVLGYYAWQRGRYERQLPARTAQAHAVADAAAMALVIVLLWVGGSVAPRWGLIAAGGLPGATIGAIIGFILADPLRHTILRGSGHLPRRPRGGGDPDGPTSRPDRDRRGNGFPPPRE